jgi:hypothetical protein
VQPELVADIPVQSPLTPANEVLPNPIARDTVPKAVSEDDRDLERILRDVTHSVKKTEEPPAKKPGRLVAAQPKDNPKKTQSVKAPKASPPVGVTLAACLVALVLTISAVLVFKNGS